MMALHYILDGYNIIKGVDSLADLPLEEGRKALLTILASQRPQGSLRNHVTVVFDGKADVWGRVHAGPAKVIFTSGETADDYIKRLLEEKKDVKNITVVTNDGELACYVRNLGTRVMAIHDFLLPKGKGKALKGSKNYASPGQNKGKQITRVMENKINKELEAVWINKKNFE